MAEQRPIRFGVMCGGQTFPAWQARCLERLLALPGVEVGLLVVEDRPAPQRRRLATIRRLLADRGLGWALFSRAVEPRSIAMRPVDLSARLASVPVLRCRVRRQGKFSEYFADGDVAEIRRHDLDFLLRFAFGIIRGEVLGAARHGVWSFHHDDPERYRGTPPGFWEIYDRDPVTGSVLQRLTERLDGGVVLQRGFFKTIDQSYVRNRDAAYFGSADWPARVCQDVRHGEAGYLEAPPASSAAPIRRSPTDRQVVRFLGILMRNFIKSQVESLFHSEQWNVGIVDAPIAAFVDGGPRPPVRWLPPPARHRFLADPFVLRRGRSLTLLVEEFDYRTRRGRIAALGSVDGRTFGAPRAVMERRGHMSYPFLLEHGGDVYCVPETSEARAVTLYRADPFPDRWLEVATLLSGFPAVDATLFRHGGRWWLFCTDGEAGPQTKLHAWHAPSLAGPYVPHAANPLKTDIRGSRPAGSPFVHRGALYRPAQDGSAGYGGAVALFRVRRLTATAFEEERVALVGPDPAGPYPDGLHTLAPAGDVTVVDGKRRAFDLPGFRHALRAKLGRVTRHVAARLSARPSPSGA